MNQPNQFNQFNSNSDTPPNNLRFNYYNDNDNQLKRKLLQQMELEELMNEENTQNKKLITENMIKDMEKLSIEEYSLKNKNNSKNTNKDSLEFNNNIKNNTTKKKTLNDDFFDIEDIEDIELPNNESNFRLVIPDSILKISKPLPEVLFKNSSLGKELVLYRPIQWPWNKKNGLPFKPSFTPLIEEIDEEEDMFESDELPPAFGLAQIYPSSITEPDPLHYSDPDNSNDADDEESVHYCHGHDSFHSSECYQNYMGSERDLDDDTSFTHNGANTQHNDHDISHSDEMDCSL